MGNNKLSSLLNEQGFSFVKLPRPIRLLELFAKDSKGHLIRIGNIDDLFIKKSVELPESQENQPVPTELGGLQDKKVDMKLSLSLLKGFLPQSVGVESAFNAASNISFSFMDARLDSTNLIQLDAYINDADINSKAKTFEDKLKDSEIYIITDVLKSQSFSVEALDSNDATLDVDGPKIEKVLEANVNMKRATENKAKIIYKGDSELAIGIKAAKLDYNKKNWWSSKEAGFTILSGRSVKVRGESDDKSVQFLSDKFISIDDNNK